MLIAFCPSQIIFVLNSAVGTTVLANKLADAAFPLWPQSACCAAHWALGFKGREELVWSRPERDKPSCTSSLGGAEWSSCPVSMPLSCTQCPHWLAIVQASSMALLSHHGLKINSVLKLYIESFFQMLPSSWQWNMIYTALSKHL